MKKKLMLTALLIGLMSIGTVYGAFLTYKSFVEIYGTKYPLGIVELETIPIAPIEGLEAREDYLGEIHVWTYSNKSQMILQLVQLSQIVTNFRSFTVKVKLDLDIVYVVDTTGSMGPYMETVKEKLVELTGVLLMMNKGQVEFAVVDFKDLPAETDVLPWTSDYETVKNYIEGLTAAAGGPIPQSHYLGFEEALALFKGKPESWVHDRVVVFVSDAPPGVADVFEFSPGGPTQASVLALADAGIKVHSVLCGPDDPPENLILRWYSDVTGGHFTHGAHRIVPGVTRDPTWIVKLTPVTPFDSFRMPLASSEPTQKEGFYTFHIYVDFYCKAVPWHEWFLTELTTHLEKAEIPPYFPPPLFPPGTEPADISLTVTPAYPDPTPIGGEVKFDWTITFLTDPKRVTLDIVDPGSIGVHFTEYDVTGASSPITNSLTWTVPGGATLGDYTVTVKYYSVDVGPIVPEAMVSRVFKVAAAG